MLGIWQAYAGSYLAILGAVMLAAFGIPLVFVPMRWARLLRWEIPPPSQLTTFLGRSLGAFICVFALYAIRAAVAPAVQPFFFELLLWLLVAMLALHIHGAIMKTQPITETIEIAMWVILILATLAFHPAG